jgi:hypothetical protein
MEKKEEEEKPSEYEKGKKDGIAEGLTDALNMIRDLDKQILEKIKKARK